ncbi:MAG TPA: aldehyde ferredoxin oxidoreductase N-terminal domain-containing protein [Candidatus Deferrimicrobium sp.]|nr:aldehyde ferredoxin oxidoreductase N-terminal domain-containing protein [Candidatus Deferrimicrobium sp.]
MEWHGYTGNILEVDLTRNKISVQKESLKDLQKFIGGMGMNCRLAIDYIKPGLDPLSPENVIILGAGPLVGTITPGSSRIVGLSKFPASGAIANSCGSMSFGFHLKQSGYDHVVISGRAEDPVYLEICDDQVELCNAIQLWGQDIIETSDYLTKKYGSSGIIAIGQAGENLVKSSLALIDKTATFGRGGLGAIMGSKNLKAILTKGTKGINIAHPKEFNALYKKIFERIRTYPHRPDWHKLGMLRNTPIAAMLGAAGQKQKAKYANERTYLKKLKKRRFACPSCPMGDKDILEIQDGDFAGVINYTSSVINPFFLLLIDGMKDHNEAVKAFDQMNRYGLDSLNLPALLDFGTSLFEKGIFTKELTGIEWKRDFTTLMQLIEMIAKRQGFGNILADGWNKLAEIYEDIAKDMVVIKGLEQVFDPRMLRLGTMEFEQVVNPKGAHVASGGSPTYLSPGRPLKDFEKHFHRMGIPQSAFNRIYSPPVKEMGVNVGRLTRYAEDWYTILTSLGLCARAQMNRFWGLESVTAFYNAVTGFDIQSEDLRIAADRSWTLLKLLNAKEGFNRSTDKFPEVWFKPLQFGEIELKFQDFYGGTLITLEIATQLLDDYYDERGWDKKIGLPTQNKLKELGLEHFK